jgi:lipase chaperone LimK
MNRRSILILTPIVLLALLWLFWPESAEKKKEKTLREQATHAAMASNPGSGEYRQFVEENRKLFTEENMYTLSQLLEMARTGRISLVTELWRLRTRCEAGGEKALNPDKVVPIESPDSSKATAMNIEECNLRIENFLREQYPAPENEKIIGLFRNYLRYEDAMRHFKMPEKITIKERYELLKNKRREIFGEADATLVFGFEETKTEVQDILSDFLKSSSAMPAEERIRKYYDLRKSKLGDYNAAVNETEPAYTRYETEIMLRGDEMQRQNTTEAQTQAMREKYFGADGAKRMAAVDAEIKQERQRIENYEAAAQQLLRENASLSESQKQDKLTELRNSILGKEEAEAYMQRMRYEEYLRKNNLK